MPIEMGFFFFFWQLIEMVWACTQKIRNDLVRSNEVTQVLGTQRRVRPLKAFKESKEEWHERLWSYT